MRNKAKIISFNEISNHVYYDESSPTFLRRKSKNIGTVAGCISGRYSVISINGVQYLTHRVVFSLCNMVDIDCDLVIDHIDGNKFNNNIVNLRIVNRSINSKNMLRKQSIMGLYNIYNDTSRDRIIVHWHENKVKKSKRFKYSLTNFESVLSLAIAFRNKLVEQFIILQPRESSI